MICMWSLYGYCVNLKTYCMFQGRERMNVPTLEVSMRCALCGRFMKLIHEEWTPSGALKYYECTCGSQMTILE